MNRALFFLILLLISQTAQAKTITAWEVLQHTYHETPLSKAFQKNNEIAQENIKKAKAQYDTNVAADLSYTQDESAQSSVIFGTRTNTSQAQFSLLQNTPLGSQFSLSHTLTFQDTNSAFVSATELAETAYTLGLRQPLLFNAFGSQNRKTVQIAKTQSSSQNYQTQNQLMQLAKQNLSLFWNLYFEQKAFEIYQKAQKLAQELYDSNLKKKNLGLIEEGNLLTFKTNLSLKKINALDSDQRIADLEQSLKAALGLSEPLEPKAVFDSTTPSLSLSLLKSEALSNNLALKSLKEEIAAQKIKLSLLKNSRLPRLDLLGSLSLNGLDTTFNKATNDVTEPHPTLSAGIHLSFPLQNRQAKSDYKSSRFLKEKLLLELQNEENQVLAQLENTVSQMTRLHQKIKELASLKQDLTQRWKAETLRFNQGRIDADALILVQNELLDTELLFWKAKTDLEQSKLNYYSALGQIEWGLKP